MVEVVLFHSVYGPRPGEAAAAARLRDAGHDVITPDLFAGETAGTVDEGFALVERIGWETIVARAREAVAGQPATAVLAGVSMGCGVVSELWAERPETAGIVFLHGVAPLPDAPRAGLPLQVHLAEPDPYEGEEWVEETRLGAERRNLAAEIYRYPGPGHYFTDATLPDYDAAAAALAWSRVLELLERV